MAFAELHISHQIMATDIYVSVDDPNFSKPQIDADIAAVITLFRDFEQRFSRFIAPNELSRLNEAESVVVSDELLEILLLAKEYYDKTEGLFDPTILNNLINEGYVVSKLRGFKSACPAPRTRPDFSKVIIETKSKTVTKPKDPSIDLGGIGKGFVVDKAAKFLARKYRNFCVDAGGDMYLSGVDSGQNYLYWAIEVESPFEPPASIELPTLILKDMALATSGTNKRTWKTEDGAQKHHLINPRTQKSAQTDIVCATVAGKTTVFCDIMAKVLVIMGSKKAVKFCEQKGLSAVIVTKDQKVHLSKGIRKYVWKS